MKIPGLEYLFSWKWTINVFPIYSAYVNYRCIRVWVIIISLWINSLYNIDFSIIVKDLSLAPLIQRPVDILFFIDGSERTGGRNFISILHFIERLSQSIPLSKEVSSGARFAVLQFGGEQDPEVLLDFSNNRRKISSLVSNAVYRDSSSTLGSAILYATENLVSNPGGRFRGVRPDAELAFVFITDGVTSDKNFAEGFGAMRRANAVGVAITVGSDIDRERLLQLTLRDKALIFNLKSFNDLALPGVVKHMAHCLG